MTDWIDELLSKSQQSKGQASSWLDGQSPILIYGTGKMARDIEQALTERHLAIHGFIDHVASSKSLFGGHPIFSPEASPISLQDKASAVVVLGVHNYQANTSAIIQRLRANGYKRLVSTVELYDSFGERLGVRYWLTSRDFYLSHGHDIEAALGLWADEPSKALYRSVLEYRMCGDCAVLPPPDTLNAYHPDDIPQWSRPLRIVDCGAYDGDTLANFIHAGIPIEAAAAFEPDPGNFLKLVTFAKANSSQLPNITLWPCGVLAGASQISFEKGDGMGSAISANGATMIQGVSLDEALPTFAPNLIKMDIEGAEYEALIGARELISSARPGLAISVYHKPEHLWQLPLLVEDLAPKSYQLYLRSHAYNDFDLVMYAVPANGTH